MTTPPEPPVPSGGRHIGNLSYDGRIWDVVLEFEHDVAEARSSYRARLCFAPSDLNEGEQPTRTTWIIVERSPDEAVRRAKSLEERQLMGLLRSTLPA